LNNRRVFWALQKVWTESMFLMCRAILTVNH